MRINALGTTQRTQLSMIYGHGGECMLSGMAGEIETTTKGEEQEQKKIFSPSYPRPHSARIAIISARYPSPNRHTVAVQGRRKKQAEG
jgi:hypothetical protein